MLQDSFILNQLDYTDIYFPSNTTVLGGDRIVYHRSTILCVPQTVIKEVFTPELKKMIVAQWKKRCHRTLA